MKCDNCGLESEFEEAFLKRRRLLSRDARHYCPPCASKRELYTLAFVYAFALMTPVVMQLAHPSLGLSWGSLFWPLLALLIYPPLVVLHEVAHALAAGALGLRAFAVTIGVGRSLVTGRFLGLRWQVRTVPLGGMTEVAGPPAPYDRLRLWLVYLAGPAVHAILALAAMGLTQLLGGTHAGPSGAALRLVYDVNVVLLVFNLLPLRAASPYGPVGTDGWNLMKLPFAKAEEMEERRAAYFVLEAAEAIRQRDLTSAQQWIDEALRRYPNSPTVQIGVGYVLIKLGDYDGARKIFAATLAADRPLKPAVRYVLLNNIAYSHAILRDANRLDEADRYSAEAYRNAPWMPAFIGTRGTVLVAMGQAEQGIPLLKRAMEQTDDLSGKAENARELAMAELQQGDRTSALHYLELARQWDPENPRTELAARQLEQASPSQTLPDRVAAKEPQAGRRPSAAASVGSAIGRLLPADGTLTRQALADWGWVALVWGFWNFILWRWFSVGPGLALMTLGVVAMYSSVVAILVGLGVVGIWIGLTMVAWGTWPEVGFGLANLALAAVLILRYRRQGGPGNSLVAAPRGDAPGPTPNSSGRGLAVGTAAAGMVSLGWLVALVRPVAAVAGGDPSAGPSALFDRFYTWGTQHPYQYQLVSALAVISVAMGTGALISRKRRRVLPAIGMLPGACALLLIFLAAVVG